MIKDDTEVLVVCNPADAKYLIESNQKGFVLDNLIITSLVPIGELTVVPKDEFLYYLDNGCSEYEG